LKEARNVIMPDVPNLDESMAQALLDLIGRESRLEESNFMGLQVSDHPLSRLPVGRVNGNPDRVESEWES